MKNNTENTKNTTKYNNTNDLQNAGKFLPIRVITINHARRLLSKIIFEFQKGTIDADYARTINYLLSSFINISKEAKQETDEKQLHEQFQQIHNDALHEYFMNYKPKEPMQDE